MKKLTNSDFSRHLANCKRRHIKNELTFDEFLTFHNSTCVYCGSSSNGIDRLFSDFSYSLGNCVPCCSLCNRMKSVSSPASFLLHVSKISKYNHSELHRMLHLLDI
jgi:hypothetical protein